MMKGDNAYVDLGFGFEGCEIKRREKISELGRKGCSEIGGYRRCVQNRWSWTRGKIVKSLVANGVSAELAVKSIDSCLECYQEKVLADLKKSKELHTAEVTKEFNKLEVQRKKLQEEIELMQAEYKRDHVKEMNKLEEKFLKSPSDLKAEFNKLKRDFEKTKFLGAKFAIYTLAATAVGGFGAFSLFTDLLP